MDKDWTLEKLGNHKYRHHRLWDGTLEMLDRLKKEGFTVSPDNSDDYYRDFEEADDSFNFGASMSECLQDLFGNQRFYDSYLLALVLDNKDARFGKQLVEAFDSIDMLLPMINIMGIDNFMYLIARNYDKSLGEQAKKMYQKLDVVEFVDWLKENVKPRFSWNATHEDILPYLVFDENSYKSLDFLDGFYDCWRFVDQNKPVYKHWEETSGVHMKNPGEVYNDCLLYPDDENAKMFAWYYWLCCGPCACHLFSMLNSQRVSFGVKTLLRNTLIDYGKGDVEFAKQLQHLYDGYKELAGWRDITFETATADLSTIKSKEEPQTSKTPAEVKAQKEAERKKKEAEAFNLIRDLLTNTAGEKDFFKDGFTLEHLIMFFKKILTDEKVLDALTKTNKMMIWVYKGIVLEKFCNIIGYLICKGVISDVQVQVANALFGMEETKTAILNWKPVDKNSREAFDREENLFKTCCSYISNGRTDYSKTFINPKIREWIDVTFDSIWQPQ